MYRKIYPPLSGMTGVVEAKLAKLLLLHGNGGAARRHAQRALTHMETLMPESALIAETRDILSQLPLEPSAPQDIQPAAISAAEVQTAELQAAELQTTELQPAELQAAELQPAESQPAEDLKCAAPTELPSDTPNDDPKC